MDISSKFKIANTHSKSIYNSKENQMQFEGMKSRSASRKKFKGNRNVDFLEDNVIRFNSTASVSNYGSNSVKQIQKNTYTQFRPRKSTNIPLATKNKKTEQKSYANIVSKLNSPYHASPYNRSSVKSVMAVKLMPSRHVHKQSLEQNIFSEDLAEDNYLSNQKSTSLRQDIFNTNLDINSNDNENSDHNPFSYSNRTKKTSISINKLDNEDYVDNQVENRNSLYKIAISPHAKNNKEELASISEVIFKSKSSNRREFLEAQDKNGQNLATDFIPQSIKSKIFANPLRASSKKQNDDEVRHSNDVGNLEEKFRHLRQKFIKNQTKTK